MVLSPEEQAVKAALDFVDRYLKEHPDVNRGDVWRWLTAECYDREG